MNRSLSPSSLSSPILLKIMSGPYLSDFESNNKFGSFDLLPEMAFEQTLKNTNSNIYAAPLDVISPRASLLTSWGYDNTLRSSFDNSAWNNFNDGLSSFPFQPRTPRDDSLANFHFQGIRPSFPFELNPPLSHPAPRQENQQMYTSTSDEQSELLQNSARASPFPVGSTFMKSANAPLPQEGIRDCDFSDFRFVCPIQGCPKKYTYAIFILILVFLKKLSSFAGNRVILILGGKVT